MWLCATSILIGAELGSFGVVLAGPCGLRLVGVLAQPPVLANPLPQSRHPLGHQIGRLWRTCTGRIVIDKSLTIGCGR